MSLQNGPSPQIIVREIATNLQKFIFAFGDQHAKIFMEAKQISLHTMSSTLPRMTLEEFLCQCETKATLTFTVALQSGDYAKITAEAHLLLSIFSALQTVLNKPRTAYRTANTALLVLLYQPEVSQIIKETTLTLRTILKVFQKAPQKRSFSFWIGYRRSTFIIINAIFILVLFFTGTIVISATSVPINSDPKIQPSANPGAKPISIPHPVSTFVTFGITPVSLFLSTGSNAK